MAIVRLDKVQSSYNGNLESVVFGADKTNGVIFHLGDLATGEREIHEVVTPADATVETQEILIHASPEVMYDPRKSGLKDFVLEAGKAGRAYHLVPGDVITLTEDLFTATPTVGQYVTCKPGQELLVPTADGSTTLADDTTPVTPRFRAKVIEETTLGYDGTTAYAIKVEAN